MKRIVIVFLCLPLLFNLPIFAISWNDINVLGEYIISMPEDAECWFEELESGQVKITFKQPPNTIVYYTVDRKRSTDKPFIYKSPIIVDIGAKIHWTTYYNNTGDSTGTNLTIERSKNPDLIIEEDPRYGTVITFEDNNLFSNLPVYYSIIPIDEFKVMSQYRMKISFNWQEYSSPIILSDIDSDDFIIAFVTPATDYKLSSDVQWKEFHKVKGSCFNYVFYDKGAYSDGWRYIEICPIEQKGYFGPIGISTGATQSGIGKGKENTLKIISSIDDESLYIDGEPYAALSADSVFYAGKDDWYLPSINELEMANEAYPNLFSRFHDYWSSTEKDADEAYTLRRNRDKDNELKYLIVRRF